MAMQDRPFNGVQTICRYARAIGDAAGGGSTYSVRSARSRDSRTFLQRAEWTWFQATLAALREECPAGMRVVVRTTRSLPGNILGECQRFYMCFVIRLNWSLGEHEAVETLIHEWAHALAWNFSHDNLSRPGVATRDEWERATHDEAWGLAYSKAYRASRRSLYGDETLRAS